MMQVKVEGGGCGWERDNYVGTLIAVEVEYLHQSPAKSGQLAHFLLSTFFRS